MIPKSRDFEKQRIPTNGGLKNQTNRSWRELKLAPTKRNHQMARVNERQRDRQAQGGLNLILEVEIPEEGEAR
jgi:hypothetical protein